MIIKTYNYSESLIEMLVIDTANYLWLGFQSNGATCTLQKVSSNNPLQVYYDLDVAVDAFTKGIINGLYLYTAVDNATIMGKRYVLSNPISTPLDFTTPGGIAEPPIDILINTHVYFLIPGNTLSNNTKLVKFTTAGVYVETIDLPTVTNATSFTVDTLTGEIWISTENSPAEYVRVYYSGTWQYTIYT